MCDGATRGAASILSGMMLLGITDNLVRLISRTARAFGSSTCCAA